MCVWFEFVDVLIVRFVLVFSCELERWRFLSLRASMSANFVFLIDPWC